MQFLGQSTGPSRGLHLYRTKASSSSSSYICHGVGPLVDPSRSHVHRSLFKVLPRFLLPDGEQYFITLGNEILHAGPEAKGSNPTTGLTLLWAPNLFRGNFNHWQVSPDKVKQEISAVIQSYWDTDSNT
jgi:hypothetical protein